MRSVGFAPHMMVYAICGLVILGIVVAAVVITVVLLTRKSTQANNAGVYMPNASALNILNERYARGEISDDEYRQKKSELLK